MNSNDGNGEKFLAPGYEIVKGISHLIMKTDGKLVVMKNGIEHEVLNKKADFVPGSYL